jgi:hypothetical protein
MCVSAQTGILAPLRFLVVMRALPRTSRSRRMDFHSVVEQGTSEISLHWLEAMHADKLLPSTAKADEPLLLDCVPLCWRKSSGLSNQTIARSTSQRFAASLPEFYVILAKTSMLKRYCANIRFCVSPRFFTYTSISHNWG